MKMSDALRRLAELSAGQWGLYTAAQAADRGVSRVTLARLVDAEQLVRLAHGVYRDAGVPPDQFEDLRTAWLSIYPQLRAEQRLQPGSLESTPASGTSAATLHGIGDHYVDRFEFTTPVRRQSQRPELRYRIRELDPVDVTIKEGLPVTTLERTIADLVEERYDLSNVAAAVRDADRQRALDEVRMVELLSPLAARNGLRRGDGAALWKRLTELAGIDLNSVVERVVADDTLGSLITHRYLAEQGETIKRAIEQSSGLKTLHDEARRSFDTAAFRQAIETAAATSVIPAAIAAQTAELKQAIGHAAELSGAQEAVRKSLNSTGVKQAMEALANSSAIRDLVGKQNAEYKKVIEQLAMSSKAQAALRELSLSSAVKRTRQQLRDE